ncbi:hypothetical protein SAMD00019534_113110 [Acytostelium subglobosum LB1]|uniref:hypothetical protein n=1 Tax=Acytostelium subglobosum LB1 TaxID=1410327 RepID=UPI0006452383|nr:hypothetical protein SAMD00019534_113110 [Acytostelium subglobosum LB1]GAM28135.1 hypothetical protein SAMD00019534_113110 [Acytostelium subglobosum LB1]|eukprot:XP_012748769.1 hypothetical protein SAMD00019534_113110 [Acytostelium subglobosum LB1]
MPFEGPRVSNQPSVFRQHFYGNDYNTFVSYYSPLGPVAMTIRLDGEIYKCLVYTEKGYELVEIPKWSVYRNCWRFIFNLDPTSYHVMCHIKPELKNFKLPKLKLPNIEDELLKIYEPDFSKVMKVGILYCKEGQNNEADMLFNLSQNASAEYNEFLNLLGEKIPLVGFSGYNGGLDTVHGNSGSHSVYTKHNDVEIMFHVSTMLPFYPNDPKQIERKKHLGNDRMMIVFSDSGKYAPNCMKSKQTQTVILVQPYRGDPTSPTSIAMGKTVSPTCTSPDERIPLTSAAVDQNEYANKHHGTTQDARFRQFLLDKLINGASSLRQAPVFQTKTQRERTFVFLNFVNKNTKNPT